MEEGRYSIQFAQDEMISVHYYDDYYNNQRSGRMVVKELGQNESPHLISSVAPPMAEYVFRPHDSRFSDCAQFPLVISLHTQPCHSEKVLCTHIHSVHDPITAVFQ